MQHYVDQVARFSSWLKVHYLQMEDLFFAWMQK